MTLRQLWARVSWRWNRRRKEAELDEEIAFHLSEEADERAADGVRVDQACRAARKDFGNATLVREVTRESWGWGGVDRVLQDVRSGIRIAGRDPSFSAVAVLTLALGIGATTAIFTVVNALILRQLPFPDAQQLVILFATTPERDVFRDTTSFLDLTAWKEQSEAFAGVAAYRQDRFNLTADGPPVPLLGLRASHDFLAVLGEAPVMGRSFDVQEQRSSAPVVLISHRLWTQRYNTEPAIVGRTVLLNEVSHTVVGVLPQRFQFPAFQDVDVVVPVPERTCRSCGYLRGVTRLKPEVRLAAGQQQLDAIAARLASEFPDSNAGRGVNAVPLQDVAVGSVRTPLLVLLGAGVCVLLIGCGNVGNLVLARGIARRQELAVRSALGAGTGRLVRQLLTESLVLAAIAAALGSVFAWWGSDLLMKSLSQRVPVPEISFQWTFLAFALLVAFAAGACSALPPAVMVWRARLTGTLSHSGRGQSEGAPQQRLQSGLIVAQTALTVLLLIGAGLLIRSFVLLQRIDLGVDARQTLSINLVLSKRNAEPVRRVAFAGEILDSVSSLPGVRAVAAHVDPPFTGGGRREAFTIDGHADPAPGRGHPASFNIVTNRFFEAMDIGVRRGRVFGDQDTADSAAVAVINETMARRFWPGGDPIGQRLRFYYQTDRDRWLTIVGVVGDVRYHGRLAEPVPQVFVPNQQPFYKAQEPFISLVVRTNGDPGPLATALQQRIWNVDKDQPVLSVQTSEQVLAEEAAEPRTYAWLLGSFAAIALAIATAGIYALSAYAVVRRTREIGIRLAVGATSGQIVRLVLRQGVVLALSGAVIGVAGALALRKVTAGFLHGITATDVTTFGLVLVIFAVVAGIATYIPARRAAAIDPALAFKHE